MACLSPFWCHVPCPQIPPATPRCAGDDVEAEFAADKAAEVGAELPHIEEPSALPGWGVWQDQQRNPKWMKQAKEKAQRCVHVCG